MKHYERKVIEFSSSDEIQEKLDLYLGYKYIGYIPWGSMSNFLILEKEYFGVD